jgi:Thioredoxin
MSNEYTSVTFAKVDVDEAEDVAASEGIQAMPTFKFYKGGIKVGEVMVRVKTCFILLDALCCYYGCRVIELNVSIHQNR